MEVVLAVLFFVAVYALIGYASKRLFQDYCSILFNYNWELGKAAGTIAATLWPLGWPAIIVIGLINLSIMIFKGVCDGFKQIRRCFRIIAKHYSEAERGEQ